MKNCFLCDNAHCPQAGIDGMYGDGCAMDNDRAMVKCAGCGTEIPESESRTDELGNIICDWCAYIAEMDEAERWEEP